MAASGMNRRRVFAVNLLIALAITLVINFSFLLYAVEIPVRQSPAPLPEYYVFVQVLYFYIFGFAVSSLNTIRGLSIIKKVLFSVLLSGLFYLFAPIGRGGEWNLLVLSDRIGSPMLMMKCSFVLIVSVLYGKIFELIYQKQKIQIENGYLKNENLQTRYNMLVNQISPHFLFNSLNSLSMLVREKSNDRALLYIDKMADTFRYMLRTGQNELTTLEDELRFTEAFLYLLMIRYENKLFCEIEIDPLYKGWQLPVLSLQPLIENAVKHNSISMTSPLRITIRTENETLVVENPIVPRMDDEEKTGIGLKNLASRYLLLTSKEIGISDDCSRFRVVLPLIEPK